MKVQPVSPALNLNNYPSAIKKGQLYSAHSSNSKSKSTFADFLAKSKESLGVSDGK